MKFILFLIIEFIILFTNTFYVNNDKSYIENLTNYSNETILALFSENKYNGSQTSPFPSFLYGFFKLLISNTTNNSIEFNLTDEIYPILNEEIIIFQHFLENKFKNNSNFYYDNYIQFLYNFNGNISIFSLQKNAAKILMKSDKFFFNLQRNISFILNNVEFIGNDLHLSYLKINCSLKFNICCTEEMIYSLTTSFCYLQTKLLNNIHKNIGIFNINSSSPYNKILIEFNNFTISNLIVLENNYYTIVYVTNKAKINVFIKNSLFSKNFLMGGYIFGTDISDKIIFENTIFKEFNIANHYYKINKLFYNHPGFHFQIYLINSKILFKNCYFNNSDNFIYTKLNSFVYFENCELINSVQSINSFQYFISSSYSNYYIVNCSFLENFYTFSLSNNFIILENVTYFRKFNYTKHNDALLSIYYDNIIIQNSKFYNIIQRLIVGTNNNNLKLM